MIQCDIEKFKAEGGLRTMRDGIADDLFLVCASYEPRSVAVAESLGNEYRSRRGLIYVNKEFLEEPAGESTKSNLDHLEKILKQHCDAVDVVRGSWLNAKEQLLSLRNALVSKDSQEVPEATITLDTTTFNRESLITAAALLRTHFPKSKIRVVCVSPKDYGEWLSRGFRGIRNVMGFAGILQSSLSTVLVVLSGFEPGRTLKIIEEHEPTKVLLGTGDPPTAQRFLERNISEQKLILARQDVEMFTFPANSVKDCHEHLRSLLQPYLAQYNVILAPMSTKLSTLGAFLVAERHPEIQITYCIPGEYNIEDYSAGADKVFVEEIPHDDSKG